jgi:hypothetical protein
VDVDVLRFEPLMDAVLGGTFHMILPDAFKIRSDSGGFGEPRKQKPDDRDQMQDKNKSRKVKVTNDAQLDAFKLKPSEDWQDFRGKHVPDRPKWNAKCQMCPRWHINGYCFSDCINAESHVTGSEVPANKTKEFCEHMDTIRDN